jgi:hypothetical protein
MLYLKVYDFFLTANEGTDSGLLALRHLLLNSAEINWM